MECRCVRVPTIGKKRDRSEYVSDFPSGSVPVVFSPVPATKSTVLSSPSLLPPFELDPSGIPVRNRLCCLRFPGTDFDSFVIFFPVGTNSHHHRIRRISAIPNSGEGGDGEFVGFVMVETMYSVDWFSVEPDPNLRR